MAKQPRINNKPPGRRIQKPPKPGQKSHRNKFKENHLSFERAGLKYSVLTQQFFNKKNAKPGPVIIIFPAPV